MEMKDAAMIKVDGMKVPFSDLVEAWKANGKPDKVDGKSDKEKMAEYYIDGVDSELAWVPYGIVTFADLKVANEAQEAVTGARILTAQLIGLIDSISYSREIEHGDKAAAIQAVTEEYVALVVEQMDDIGENGVEELGEGEVRFAESISGATIKLVENATLQQNDNRAPLLLDMQIIKPGPGNKRDRRWYPANVLERDANVFVGTDVFVTDHAEHGEKTKVGKIREVIGLTPEGAPIGRTIIFDPATAEKTRNRAAAGELETLHCSILASGKARDGKINGEDYSVVESITQAQSVDLVGRAGAGGRAISIAESEAGLAMERYQTKLNVTLGELGFEALSIC